MKYIVTEIQSGDTIGILDYTYDNRVDADSQFYTLCSYAVKSAVLTHTVMMYTDEGFVLDMKCFKHEPEPEPVPDPEPEPEPEPETTE